MNYRYVAANKVTGQRIRGVTTAASVTDLVSRLRQEAMLPLKVQEIKPAAVKTNFKIEFLSRPVNGKELAVFTRQLAATLSAGLLLTEALEAIADDLENVRFRNILLRIKEDIQGGFDFSSALAKHSRVFSVTYVAIVRTGEATGNLHITMTNLAQYLENTERIKEKVKNAVRYPLFVIGFAVLVVLVIVLFLIPRFQSMFSNAGAELPLLTRIVVGVSEFMIHYFPLFFIGFVGLWVGVLFSLKYEKPRRIFDTIKIKLPIIGKEIIHKSLVSRFCRTLGFLFAGGVGLSQSLEITGQVVNHSLMQEATAEIRDRVVSGASLAEEIRKHRIFPRLAAKMVAVGERTGKISDMLTRTSDYYDEELDSSLQSLTTLLEPALIIFIGGIVLIVVLALYLPIFQMSSAIR